MRVSIGYRLGHRVRLTVGLCLVGLHCLTNALAQPTANDSQIPYTSGVEAFKKGKWLEADRWFEVTQKDFPKQLAGQRALAMQLLDRLAKELSQVRVAHHLLDASKMELKEADRRRWTELRLKYEAEGLRWGGEILTKAQLFLQNDTNLPLQLEISLDPQLMSVGKQRARLSKGEFLDAEEMEALERGEWAAHMVGLLSEVLRLPEERWQDGVYGGTLFRPAFYRTVGVRLFVLWQHGKQQKFADLARDYFKKVVSLTEAEPYQSDRQQAFDFLRQLETPSKDAKK